jgi:hypothetical protein
VLDRIPVMGDQLEIMFHTVEEGQGIRVLSLMVSQAIRKWTPTSMM